MSKIILKYISVFALLFFSGFSNLHAIPDASLNANNYSITSDSTFKHSAIKPAQHTTTTNLVLEITEVDETENEESASKNNQSSFKNFLADILNLLTYNETLQSEKAFNFHKNFQDKSSSKLHVRLQVFII
ncbi:hypothetical protein AAFN75_06835 [Algibacter sp. AS12]|uniref:hypothetical protein n=1 Tax=Algibacter sp. AS12 TaxID=3135773 RepID=UPI00398B6AB1